MTRESGRRRSPTGSSRRFSSPTSSARRSGCVELGDREWAELLARHHAAVRRELERFRGREVDTPATVSSPPSTVPPARSGARWRSATLRATSASKSAPVCTPASASWSASKVTGIAVHIGARVASPPAPDEVLVSATVRDLVSGSGIGFEERGEHELKGIGTWRLYAVLRIASYRVRRGDAAEANRGTLLPARRLDLAVVRRGGGDEVAEKLLVSPSRSRRPHDPQGLRVGKRGLLHPAGPCERTGGQLRRISSVVVGGSKL